MPDSACRWTLAVDLERLAAMNPGYIYILTNDRQTVLYIGCTTDLRKRLTHHRHRLIPGFTKKYNVDRLVYFEQHPDIGAARMRERQLKDWSRGKKEALIAVKNPARRDLFDETVSYGKEV
jgi:putative endonuclease